MKLKIRKLDEKDLPSTISFCKTKRNSAGFTLVELIVAIGIFGLVILGIGSILVYGLQYRAVIMEQLKTQTEGRQIIQDFVNEVRRSNYSSIGAYPIEQVGEQEFIFYTNIDEDSWRERVRYFLDGNILKKGVIKPGGTPVEYDSGSEVITEMIHDVYNTTTPIFYYYGEGYDGSGSALSQPVSVAQVRVVKFDLYLEADPNMSPKPLRVEGVGQIRNLKSN